MNGIVAKCLLPVCGALACFGSAVADELPDSLLYGELEEVVVGPRRVRKLDGVGNTDLISASELRRAACCNLGESFSTNPSVDVNYSDAATGARQIRLLGLSGSYVQMLTENIPNMRGAAAPFALGYIPGPWMQSIQVSKGASSVKNGYESITGQINVEMKKPQLDPSLSVNMYYDMMNKLEANVDGNLHLGRNWSAGALAHFENGFTAHDSDGDGFADMPRVRQVSFMPRVAYLGSAYVFQAAAKFIDERRRSGQTGHHAVGEHPYLIDIDTRRWEAFTKNAYIFDRDNEGNVALILSGSLHDQDAAYGLRLLDAEQKELYASLMFERKWNTAHALSAGLSYHYDGFRYRYRLAPDAARPASILKESEGVAGGYAQYTLDLDSKFLAMAGVRYDYSSAYGSMLTPRMHLRYNPADDLSFHASAGRGFRTPRPLSEFASMLASSRTIYIADDLMQESAWNLGAGASYALSLGGRKLGLSAEYYYTTFTNQLTLNLSRDPHAAYVFSSGLASRSHCVQVELTFDPLDELSLSAAWRLTDVKGEYGQERGLTDKPLQSRHKGLFSVGYNPRMGIWQFDVTCAVNGRGTMPEPYALADGRPAWSRTFNTYVQLNAQITRNFRHWAVYIGGENLTNFRQPDPIKGASDPWGPDFDATMVYGPLQGAMVYVGFRYNITKYL